MGQFWPVSLLLLLATPSQTKVTRSEKKKPIRIGHNASRKFSPFPNHCFLFCFLLRCALTRIRALPKREYSADSIKKNKKPTTIL
jgi:hypothetical protein